MSLLLNVLHLCTQIFHYSVKCLRIILYTFHQKNRFLFAPIPQQRLHDNRQNPCKSKRSKTLKKLHVKSHKEVNKIFSHSAMIKLHFLLHYITFRLLPFMFITLLSNDITTHTKKLSFDLVQFGDCFHNN